MAGLIMFRFFIIKLVTVNKASSSCSHCCELPGMMHYFYCTVFQEHLQWLEVRAEPRPAAWSRYVSQKDQVDDLVFPLEGPLPAIGLMTLLYFCRPASFHCHWSFKNRKQNVALARISLGVLISGKVVLSSLHMYLATIILTVYHNYKSNKHSEYMRYP